MKRKTWIGVGAAAAVAVLVGAVLYKPFPSDRTPEGAYMRLARAVSEDKLELAFSYLEDDAMGACYTVSKARSEAAKLVEQFFPEPERGAWLAEHRWEIDADGGPGIFAAAARQRGWPARLKQDLSGMESVEVAHEVVDDNDQAAALGPSLATVVTARGTRYTFRRQSSGGYGLTAFTAELVVLGNTAARDLEIVESAAKDYARVKSPQ